MAYVATAPRVALPTPTGAVASATLRKVTFPAMGTKCEIQFAADDDAQAREFEENSVGWVQAFEAKYSRFKPESLISRINAAAGREWIEVDAEMEQMLKLCDTLHFMTQGVLDPTMLPLIKLWSWKTENPRVPTADEITAARRLVGWKKIQRRANAIFLPEAGMSLDFGGFAKELAVDRVAQLAVDHGIANVLVDFGRNLRALGTPPGRRAWQIGLEDPLRPGTHSANIAVTGKGVASSGDNIRGFTLYGRHFTHILDPRTGSPVGNGCVQSTAIAGTCFQAGILSTTAFVLGIQKGLEFIQGCPGAEGLILTGNVRAQTRGFSNYVVSS